MAPLPPLPAKNENHSKVVIRWGAWSKEVMGGGGEDVKSVHISFVVFSFQQKCVEGECGGRHLAPSLVAYNIQDSEKH